MPLGFDLKPAKDKKVAYLLDSNFQDSHFGGSPYGGASISIHLLPELTLSQVDLYIEPFSFVVRLNHMNGLSACCLTKSVDNATVISPFSSALSFISARNLLREPFYL